MTFADRYLPIASYFPGDTIERVDVPLFTVSVLREVFANATCHRDYTSRSGSISFAIYNDRLEIWSYGLFPPGVSSTDIKTLKKSVPRNSKIATILYYRKIIESWGRGIDMIVTECTDLGHPEPSFRQNSAGVTVTLPSKQTLGPTQENDRPQTLSSRQQEIITLVKDQGQTTLSYLMAHLKAPPSERTLQTELSGLKKMGLVESTGFGRGSKWTLPTEIQKNTEPQ